jgi:anti-sigma regulatory factor (Ser/Thr protein kinase)
VGVSSVRRYPPDPAILASARSFAAHRLDALDLSAVEGDVKLLLTELITNVIIHARTDFEIRVEPSGDGVRVEVIDGNETMPVAGTLTPGALSGRGLTLVQSISTRWGAHRNDAGGKTVWFEVVPGVSESSAADDLDALLAMWDDNADYPPESGAGALVEVVVPDLPVQQLVAAKAHMEDLLREVQLVLLSKVQRPPGVSPWPALVAIARRLDAAAEEFAEGRRQIRLHALEAAARGQEYVTLRLHLSPDAAGPAARYSEAVRDAEELGAAGDLLVTAEHLKQYADIRRRYMDAIVEQLGAHERRRGS